MVINRNIKYLSIVTSFLVFLLATAFSKSSNEIPEDMVMIPGGEYTLFFGNKSGTTVEVPSFLMEETAVTNEEFLEFVKMNPKWSRSRIPKIYADTGYLQHWESDFVIGKEEINLPNSPVVNVSWFAANAYSKWKGKRLPTIDEWEYAANAEIIDAKKSKKEIILDWYSKPTPMVIPAVKTTFKNEFQLYDMHGLVWEWVADFNSIVMDSDSRSNSSLKRDLFCASGSFGAADKEDYASFMRFAYRSSLKANYTVANLGFRCAKDI